MTLKLGMRHWLREYYQIYSNDDLGLTLTYFTARSILVPFVFLFFFVVFFLFCFFVRKTLKLQTEACEVNIGMHVVK